MSGAPLLCLDIGLKRTGMAVSESGLAVRPLATIQSDYPDLEPLRREVVDTVRTLEIATIVVGMPQTRHDGMTAQADMVDEIVQELVGALRTADLDPEIVPYNEFGSTKAAKRAHPELDDNAAAAAMLLQEYLQEAE